MAWRTAGMWGAAALLALGGGASAASAEIVQKTAQVGRTSLAYQLYTPPGYDPAKSYPTVLLFSGGPQTIEGAKGSITADWAPEAAKRGYVVIAPAAPGGELFFEKGDRVFPAFLDQIRRDYHVTGKLHLAGHSNGGLSAFHVAARWPAYFSTVTGYPGLFDEPDLPKMVGLKPMCLYMHVGDGDPIWWAAMQDQYEQMQKQGFRIRLSVEKGQGHRIKAADVDLPRRLFDEIEGCR